MEGICTVTLPLNKALQLTWHSAFQSIRDSILPAGACALALPVSVVRRS